MQHNYCAQSNTCDQDQRDGDERTGGLDEAAFINAERLVSDIPGMNPYIARYTW